MKKFFLHLRSQVKHLVKDFMKKQMKKTGNHHHQELETDVSIIYMIHTNIISVA